MITTERGTLCLDRAASADDDLNAAIRSYERTYVLWHGRQQAAETFGVSRHTLWRILERGYVGRAVPDVVLNAVGGSVEAVEATTQRLVVSEIALNAATRRLAVGTTARESVAGVRPLPQGLEDALLLLCAAPLATVKELAASAASPSPHCATGWGSSASGAWRTPWPTAWASWGLIRSDGTSLPNRASSPEAGSSMAPNASSASIPCPAGGSEWTTTARVPTTHCSRSPGAAPWASCARGATLPSANLRYRLRSMENLPSNQRATVTLVLTHSDQSTRRAVRTLVHPMQHRTTFVATEGELLAGDHRGVVWQQCGADMGDNPPVKVAPGVSLDTIVVWTDRLVEIDEADRRRYGFKKPKKPTPDPEALYPSHRQAGRLEVIDAELGRTEQASEALRGLETSELTLEVCRPAIVGDFK